MQIQQEVQRNPVADEVLALTAVVRPILTGVLFAIRRDLVRKVGGHENVSLELLSRLYKPGDGDCGICFEYAVHDAMNRNEARVVERVEDALKLCRIPGGASKSILFGAEKSGALHLIDTAKAILTDDSSLLYGTAGRPVKLRRHLDSIVGAFKNTRTKRALPYSIAGLWKADLFVGDGATDKWVGTSVKNNAAALEAAKGLRIGIVPTKQGRSDKVKKDDSKNLIVCPLGYDGDFMQTFYEGFQIVQAVLASDGNLPSDVMLPTPAHRQVARLLASRRDFPILAVIDAIKPFAQPELLKTENKTVDLQTLKGETIIDIVVAPISSDM
jgi:hypothetical protein